MTLGGPEGIILLALVLLIFGGSQLPKLARNLGRAQKEFRDGIDQATNAEESEEELSGSSDSSQTS